MNSTMQGWVDAYLYDPSSACQSGSRSRPVTYLTWEVRAVDGKEHTVSIYYDNSAELVVNTADQKVSSGPVPAWPGWMC